MRREAREAEQKCREGFEEQQRVNSDLLEQVESLRVQINIQILPNHNRRLSEAEARLFAAEGARLLDAAPDPSSFSKHNLPNSSALTVADSFANSR